MGWAKIDDRFCVHPKTLACSLAARGLWVSALSWVAGSGTDGVVPRAVLAMVGATPKHAAELVKARLWDTHAEGYAFRDYLDYNPSAEEQAQRRGARAAAGRRGGYRSAETRRSKHEANREAKPEANASPFASTESTVCFDSARSKREAKRNPVPVPVPVPGERGVTTPSASLSPERAWSRAVTVTESPSQPASAKATPEIWAEFVAVFAHYPNQRGREAAWDIWRRIGTPELARRILAALQWQRSDPEWLRDHGRFVPRFAKYLEARRWEDEPTRVQPAFATPQTAGNAQSLAEALAAIDRGEA